MCWRSRSDLFPPYLPLTIDRPANANIWVSRCLLSTAGFPNESSDLHPPLHQSIFQRSRLRTTAGLASGAGIGSDAAQSAALHALAGQGPGITCVEVDTVLQVNGSLPSLVVGMSPMSAKAEILDARAMRVIEMIRRKRASADLEGGRATRLHSFDEWLLHCTQEITSLRISCAFMIVKGADVSVSVWAGGSFGIPLLNS